MVRFIVGGIVAVALVILIAAFYPNRNEQSGLEQVVGTTAPDLTLPLTTGARLRLTGLRGHDVLLNVWASWCGPCRREMPALERLARAKAGSLVVLAVDQGEAAAIARRYARQFGVTFPIAVDAEQVLGTELHLQGLPSSFFIDRGGVIRDAVDGEMTFEVMSRKADSLMKGSSG